MKWHSSVNTNRGKTVLTGNSAFSKNWNLARKANRAFAKMANPAMVKNPESHML